MNKQFIFLHPILILSAIYFFSRLLFLHAFPIFNDEAIYLDWGWKELNVPGALFYSLLDGKQPFLMWVFGLSQGIFSDQLFAGRFVAIIAGLLTMYGLYKIAEGYFSKKVGIIASLLYIVIPIFLQYDRLALMESSISACAIWSVYFLQRFLDGKRTKYAVLLGLALGIGFFIKSTMLIFALSAWILLAFFGIKEKKERWKIYSGAGISIGTALVVTSLLFLQPMYWQTLSMNSRYSLTVSDLLRFPFLISHFFKNLLGNAHIIFFFITPIIGVLGIVQCIQLLRDTKRFLLSWWFLLTLFLQTLLVLGTSQRYVVSFLPLLCLFAASFIVNNKERLATYYYVLVAVVISIPLLFTFIQITNPLAYIQSTQNITSYTDTGLVEGQISGYGIEEVVKKIEEVAQGKPLFVATAINIGNPESALQMYFHKNDTVKVGFFDRQMFGAQLDEYECIRSTVPIIFVSRDEQQAGLNTYFQEFDRVHHPLGNYSLGLYTLKADCTGKSVTIDPFSTQ